MQRSTHAVWRGRSGQAGLREYYDPFTGEGMGARDFSWSSRVMELVDPDPAASCSHISAVCEDGTRERDQPLP
jgi:hypothetical protein